MSKNTDNLAATAEAADGAKKSKGKRIFNIVFTVFSVMVLVFSVVILFVALTNRAQGKTPELFGRTMHVVVTNSMENPDFADEIRVGDLVFAQNVTKDELHAMLEEGQTVDLLFWYDIFKNGQKQVVVHRVIDYTDTHYTTQGINPANKGSTETFTHTDIVGVKTGQSRVLGNIFYFFTNHSWVLFLLLGILLLYVIVSEVINIVRIKSKQVREANEKDIESIRARARADVEAQLGKDDKPEESADETTEK